MKFRAAARCGEGLLVAPLAGAWIEIRRTPCRCRPFAVAPLAGAWIEIYNARYCFMSKMSRPPRGGVD